MFLDDILNFEEHLKYITKLTNSLDYYLNFRDVTKTIISNYT